ncbi:hypothetical protein [Luteimonas sp. MC1825]|uniref:hypothetical protein n=1 Tax=Luteimonas sp. MC1825 TaxID=2761107 RepID=UPI00161A61EB|nr:hypothetical protein [Luteimonas sp. MC1825]MBB6598367.1 hypothetical protein [Luteimonas sp. MC1825]QOC88568.1 hypothetical protein IDM46_02065 [Luteimonas sp. MC1825]
MFSTLFAVVIALAIGHGAPAFAAAMRDDGWYQAWLRWLDGRFPGDSFWRGPGGVLLALLPPLLVVALLQLLLRDVVFGLPSLLFGVALLFYAWGPRDLDRDVDVIIDAPDPTARSAALALLRPPAAAGAADAGDPVGRVFSAALRRWFGVLFWFLLLGPAGALLYRLAAIAAEGEPALYLPAGFVDGARRLLALLDWPAAQLMALSLALVGNFDVVVGAWKAGGGARFTLDAGFLAAVGRASVRHELEEDGMQDAALPQALRDAMSLVWRILLAWLALLALFVVAGWVN